MSTDTDTDTEFNNRFEKCVVNKKYQVVYPGEVCSLDMAKQYGILDKENYYKDDYSDLKTFNDTIDDEESRDKELCVQRDTKDSAYAYCSLEHGIGFIRKAGEADKCITVSCPSGFEDSRGVCKKPLEDYAVSKRSRCDERWYDWFMIPNYHLGNKVYQQSVGVCYGACPPYHVPGYARDPVDYIPAENEETRDALDKCLARNIYLSGKYRDGSDYSALAWIYRLTMTPSVVKAKLMEDLDKLRNTYGERVNDAYHKLVSSVDQLANQIATDASSIRENIFPPSDIMLNAHRTLYTEERLLYAYDVCTRLRENENEFAERFAKEMNDSKEVIDKKITMLKQACNALFCNRKDDAIQIIGKPAICFDGVKTVKLTEEEVKVNTPPSSSGARYVQNSMSTGIRILVIVLVLVILILFFTDFIWPKLKALYYWLKKIFTGFGKSKAQMIAEEITNEVGRKQT